MEQHPRHRDEQQPDNMGAQFPDALWNELPKPPEGRGILSALLTDVVVASCSEALSQCQEIDTSTARMIAYLLVTHAGRDDSLDSMKHFMESGDGRHEDLRSEYDKLARDPHMPAEGRMLLDILGTHLFHREHPETIVNVPGGLVTRDPLEVEVFKSVATEQPHAIVCQITPGLPALRKDRIKGRIEEATARYGDAFRAFLRLPGINAAEPGLIGYFLATRMEPNLAAAVLAGEVAPPVSGGAMPPWEGVEVGGRLYVFTR